MRQTHQCLNDVCSIPSVYFYVLYFYSFLFKNVFRAHRIFSAIPCVATVKNQHCGSSTASSSFNTSMSKTCDGDTILQFFLILVQFFFFQGFRFCRQEARQLSRERLPPVCRVGSRTARLGHRQLHQQGHAVAAPVEGAGETVPTIERCL